MLIRSGKPCNTELARLIQRLLTSSIFGVILRRKKKYICNGQIRLCLRILWNALSSLYFPKDWIKLYPSYLHQSTMHHQGPNTHTSTTQDLRCYPTLPILCMILLLNPVSELKQFFIKLTRTSVRLSPYLSKNCPSI